MKRKQFGLVGIIALLCLSGCGDGDKTKLYGDKITRSEATSILSSISEATSASSYVLPSAFYAEKTTLTWAVIFVAARTDKITYDKTNQYYCDVCGGTTIWVYYKDSAMYELKSETSTDSSSKLTTTKTYTTTTSSFDDAIYESRTDIFIPTPRSIPQDAIIDTPKKLLEEFQDVEKDGSYPSGNITYSFKDEEYRSKGAGYLYLSYKEVPSDGSSSGSCSYIFENSLLIKGYSQSGLFQPGGDYTWATPSEDYPNLSEFTKR
jgi:hypothetical protein